MVALLHGTFTIMNGAQHGMAGFDAAEDRRCSTTRRGRWCANLNSEHHDDGADVPLRSDPPPRCARARLGL